MLKHYEFTYLTRQEMTEEEAKSLQDKLAASIQAKEGTITNLPKAYKKRLAYRIKKQDAAYVNTILFQLDASKLEELKKETEIVSEILRGLIVFYKPTTAKRIAEDRIRGAASDENAPVKEEKPAAAETPIKPTPAQPAIEAATVEPKIEKEEKVEVKKAETETETKEETEKSAKDGKEAKTAKPRPRKTKSKAELQDIEQKLDEILK